MKVEALVVEDADPAVAHVADVDRAVDRGRDRSRALEFAGIVAGLREQRARLDRVVEHADLPAALVDDHQRTVGQQVDAAEVGVGEHRRPQREGFDAGIADPEQGALALTADVDQAVVGQLDRGGLADNRRMVAAGHRTQQLLALGGSDQANAEPGEACPVL